MRIFLKAAIVLMLLNGSWMAFDGARALVVGDYVTPKSGPYAGQLGPWAGTLEAAGIDPRSTPVKVAFVLLGGAAIGAAVCSLRGAGAAHPALVAVAVLDLWYLPFGTLTGGVLLIALLLSRRRRR